MENRIKLVSVKDKEREEYSIKITFKDAIEMKNYLSRFQEEKAELQQLKVENKSLKEQVKNLTKALADQKKLNE